jgi:hypothetical protein
MVQTIRFSEHWYLVSWRNSPYGGNKQDKCKNGNAEIDLVHNHRYLLPRVGLMWRERIAERRDVNDIVLQRSVPSAPIPDTYIDVGTSSQVINAT